MEIRNKHTTIHFIADYLYQKGVYVTLLAFHIAVMYYYQHNFCDHVKNSLLYRVQFQFYLEKTKGVRVFINDLD